MAELGKTKAALNCTSYLQKRERTAPLTLDIEDRARIALTQRLLGRNFEGAAQTSMQQLWNLARWTGGLCSWTALYHSGQAGVGENMPDVESTAWVVMAAEANDPDDPRIDAAVQWLMTERDDDHWTTCPETIAAVLLALSQHLRRSQELRPDFTADVLLNGNKVASERFTPESIDDTEPLIDIPADRLAAGRNIVTIDAKGEGRCYYSVETKTCVPVAVPQRPSLFRTLIERMTHTGAYGPLPMAPSGYRIKRVFLRTTSRRNFLMEDTVPKPDTEFNPRENIVVRLIIDCTRPGSRLIVDEPVPAGCRITELSGDQYADWSNWWDYTDVRDDRVVFYIQDLPRGRHEIDYHLQAQTPGRYDVMPTTITSMSDPSLYTQGEPGRIAIDE
jgi:uncharacterized protein YfaS (alpha-2-macroglobulin family)